MSKLLFKMYGVPDDEIEDVRELCEVNNFAIYETEVGRWGIGLAAIWLSDETQYESAKAILDEYQQARYQNAQQDRLKMQSLSFTQGLYVKYKQDPEKFSMSLLGLAAILAISLYPFMNL